jgi:hypothetical protein
MRVALLVLLCLVCAAFAASPSQHTHQIVWTDIVSDSAANYDLTVEDRTNDTPPQKSGTPTADGKKPDSPPSLPLHALVTDTRALVRRLINACLIFVLLALAVLCCTCIRTYVCASSSSSSSGKHQRPWRRRDPWAVELS